MDQLDKSGTFIITGAGKGLGRELARRAYRRGFSIALISRTVGDLESLRAELTQSGDDTLGRKITIHPVDLVNESEVSDAFLEIGSKHPRIRGLINCAGTWMGRGPVESLTKQDLLKALELNFFSAFSCTREVLALHRRMQDGKDLAISFMGATASLQGRKNVAAFCLGKGATRILAQSLAREVGPDGIHVSHFVLDGLFDNERTLKLNPDMPRDRFMKLSEIAEAVLTVMLQDRSCWTFETDLRPYNESW